MKSILKEIGLTVLAGTMLIVPGCVKAENKDNTDKHPYELINTMHITELGLVPAELDRLTKGEAEYLICRNQETLNKVFEINDAKHNIVRRSVYNYNLDSEQSLFMWIDDKNLFNFMYLTEVGKGDCVSLPKSLFK